MSSSAPVDSRLPPIGPLDRRLAVPMFVVALLHLMCLAGALHLHEAVAYRTTYLVSLAGLLALTPLFWAEFVMHRLARSPRWKQDLLACLIPPLRLGSRDHVSGECLWLPRRGWVRADRHLLAELEKAFGPPMIVIALLVLPLMAVEHYMADRIAGNENFAALIHLATGLIWLAFTFEFIVMISLAEKKLKYCKEHWIDLAVILLPLVAFLRALRLGRLLRLQQLSKTARVFRMRGTMMKAYRAILLLNAIKRLVQPKPAVLLSRLREKEQEKLRELRALREEIHALEASLAVAPLAATSDAA